MNLESIVGSFLKEEKASMLVIAKDEDLLLSAVDMLFSNKVTNVAQIALLQQNMTKFCYGEVDSVTFWENRLGEQKLTSPTSSYIDSVHSVMKAIRSSNSSNGKKLWLSVGGSGDEIKYFSSVLLEAKRTEKGISFSVWRNKFGISEVMLSE